MEARPMVVLVPTLDGGAYQTLIERKIGAKLTCPSSPGGVMRCLACEEPVTVTSMNDAEVGIGCAKCGGFDVLPRLVDQPMPVENYTLGYRF